jgi:hypothetical protein
MPIVPPALSVIATMLPRSSAWRNRRFEAAVLAPSYQTSGSSTPGPWIKRSSSVPPLL